MEVNVSKEGNFFTLDINIPKGLVDRELDAVAEKLKPKVVVDGFRPGNTPINIIKTKYADVVKAEASTKLLYSAVAQGLKDNNIKNAGNPVLDEEFRPTDKKKFVGRFGLDGTLKFRVKVEAPPEIVVEGYKGVKVDLQIPVLDDWFVKEMASYRVAFGNKNSITRPSELGDQVVVDFVGKANEQLFENGSHENYEFLLGNDDFIPGFDQHLFNRMVGDSFKFKISLPPNFSALFSQGQEVEFECAVKQVNQVDLHPLDDSLATKMGHESLEVLKASYKDLWVEKFEKPYRAHFLYHIMNEVLEKNPFTVPTSWVENEFKTQTSRLGVDPKNIQNSPDIVNSLLQIAERSVKTSFVLDRIYEQEESLKLTAEDIERAAQVEAVKYGVSPFEFLDRIRKNNQYEGFVAMQAQEKVVDFLIDNCVLKGDSSSWLMS